MRPDSIKELTLLGIIAGTVVIFGFIVNGYLSGRFFNRVSTSVVVVAILAAAQALVIFSRNIDLSVSSIVGFSAYLTADFLTANQWANPVVAMIVAMAVGAVLGSVNGWLVAYGKIPAIIVTLGTLALFRTMVSLYSGGANVIASGLPDWVLNFNNVTLVSMGGFDIRLVFVIAVAVVVILQLAMRRLRVGRRLYAIGSNPDAAQQAGLAAPRLIMLSFVCAGALAGLAGFMFMVRTGTISATAGTGLELQSVAAAVVGGVSIFGGSGTMFGAFLGAVLINTLELSLVRVPQVSEFWRDAALGILILGAVILDAALQRRFARRLTKEIESPEIANQDQPTIPVGKAVSGGTADA
jgi:rhamnose transport system permease protein